MEKNNELIIIRKIEKYIEYMLTILIKLPRTEKFSSGTEIKTSMYDMYNNKWIDMQKYKYSNEMLSEIGKMLGGLIKSLGTKENA